VRETDEICVQIEGLTKTTIIKKNKKTEIAKIRSRVKWTEQEGKSTRNFFIVERKRVKKSYGILLRCQTVAISMSLTR
jgi:hypothetical protein